MKKQGISLGLVVVLTVLLALSNVYISQASSPATNLENDGIRLSLKPGDIIFCYDQTMDWLIPGYWTHVAMFVGFDAYRRGWAVESDLDGVHFTRVQEFRNYQDLALGRVSANSSQTGMALDFAKAQVGKPYDFNWLSKQVYGSAYYCSELVWASYYVAGVDVDKNPGWSMEYANGVAPQELYEDADVSVYWQRTVHSCLGYSALEEKT